MKRPEKQKVQVKQKVIEDFNRMYLENCDNKKMNIK